jgi:acyl carrier protein
VLAGLWAEVLKIEKVGVNDNFFDRGGYSLLATRVTARIREAFGIELPLRTLFKTPILGELSKPIDTARQNLPAGDRLSLASQEADRVRPWFLVK